MAASGFLIYRVIGSRPISFAARFDEGGAVSSLAIPSSRALSALPPSTLTRPQVIATQLMTVFAVRFFAVCITDPSSCSFYVLRMSYSLNMIRIGARWVFTEMVYL